MQQGQLHNTTLEKEINMLKIQNDITKEKYLQEHYINIELNKNINESKIN